MAECIKGSGEAQPHLMVTEGERKGTVSRLSLLIPSAIIALTFGLTSKLIMAIRNAEFIPQPKAI